MDDKETPQRSDTTSPLDELYEREKEKAKANETAQARFLADQAAFARIVEPELDSASISPDSEPRIVAISSKADLDKALYLRGGDVLRVSASNLLLPVAINIRGKGPIFVIVIGIDNCLSYSERYNRDHRIVWAPHQARFRYVPLGTY